MSHFIGYASIEDWAESIDTSRPVYALPIESPGATNQTGIRRDDLAIVCAQTDGQEVHYFRMTTGFITFIADKPFDVDADARRERRDQAWGIVLDWLEERFTVRLGLVAMPRDLKVLDGWPRFLRWDNNTRRFYCRDEAS